MNENEIRQDWNLALVRAEEKDMPIANKIGWGFSYQDLLVLGCLHEAGRHCGKIEDLLEDCNFHKECSLLHKRHYDIYKAYVFEEYLS